MPTIDQDLRYFSAGVDEMQSYLLSDHLYWPLDVKTRAGETAFPNLTLGNLLLVRARLEARPRTLEQDSQLGELLLKLEQVRGQWRTAWSKKAERSLRSRLELWGDYLDEYRRSPESQADRYGYEVQRRVMLELLLPEADHVAEAIPALIRTLDGMVRAFLVAGDFIWEAELQAGFPRERYWYLYGRLGDRLVGDGI